MKAANKCETQKRHEYSNLLSSWMTSQK